eukprot:2578072-Pyramimonas_sp.AAC.1
MARRNTACGCNTTSNLRTTSPTRLSRRSGARAASARRHPAVPKRPMGIEGAGGVEVGVGGAASP